MKNIDEILRDKDDSRLDEVIRVARQQENIMLQLLEGLWEKNEVVRYNCYKSLFRLSEDDPAVLVGYWDRFVDQLQSENTYHKLSALNILANLVRVDGENRFDDLFEGYFGLLENWSLVVVRYVAMNGGKIALAKPHLREKISERLLRIENLDHKQSELIKSDVIDSFDVYFHQSDDRESILGFVNRQLSSESPRTRKRAKAFLSKHGG